MQGNYDRAAFFPAVRRDLFGRTLKQSQVDGMNIILDRAPDDMPTEHLAYCLATAFHETARTMQPIEEYGRGKGKVYGTPDLATKQTYYGRGFVQLTWKANYDRLAGIVMADLVNHPELALRPDLAATIMFEGMTRGLFTGKRLQDYFGTSKSDPVGARRIINGTDKAEAIAGYHRLFLKALEGAKTAEPQVAKSPAPKPAVVAEAPKPARWVEVTKPKSWWDRFKAGLRGEA